MKINSAARLLPAPKNYVRGFLYALSVVALIAQTAIGAAPSATPAPSPSKLPLASTPWPLPSLDYFVKHLPAPPKQGGFRDRLDLQDVIARQAQMTPTQLQHVQWWYNFNVFTFSEVLGSHFEWSKYPKTAAFFAKVAGEANIVISALKEHYQRLRPFQAHPAQVHLYVKNEPGYGYPSGHTTRGRLFAYILSYLDPEKRRPFLNAAEQVGVDRILAGEHYQTDLEAGRKLGKLLYYNLMKDPSFRQEMTDLSAAEWNKGKPTKK